MVLSRLARERKALKNSSGDMSSYVFNRCYSIQFKYFTSAFRKNNFFFKILATFFEPLKKPLKSLSNRSTPATNYDLPQKWT